MSHILSRQNHATDLAVGDQYAAAFSWKEFEIIRIGSPEDPHFPLVYQKLWEEFGRKGELEQEDILAKRLAWDPKIVSDDYSFSYEIIAIFKDQEFAAVRDHTVILSHRPPVSALVHLSHVLIAPPFRGSGMVAWLRSWPVTTARSCLVAAGLPADCPLALIAEMEPRDPVTLGPSRQLRSYERGGFLMVDPRHFTYFQPDFRPSSIIDRDRRGKPVELCLLMRRMGREDERVLSGAELLRMVSGLYQMYARSLRAQEMAQVWMRLLESGLHAQDQILLFEPSEAVL